MIDMSCHVCGKDKIVFKTAGGKFFCSLDCLNEYCYTVDWKSLDARFFRQPKEEKAKGIFERLKGVV
jgi:hypothetical protein